MIQRIFIS